MKKVLRRAALALAVVLGALALLFAGYVGYLQFQYYRIEDNLALEVASAPPRRWRRAGSTPPSPATWASGPTGRTTPSSWTPA